jgi:hypothetical protein
MALPESAHRNELSPANDGATSSQALRRPPCPDPWKHMAAAKISLDD